MNNRKRILGLLLITIAIMWVASSIVTVPIGIANIIILVWFRK